MPFSCEELGLEQLFSAGAPKHKLKLKLKRIRRVRPQAADIPHLLRVGSTPALRA